METLRLTEYAADLGYDAALVRTPHFYKDDAARRTCWPSTARLPIVRRYPYLIYNVPSFTGYDMPAEVVIESRDHPNIIGIKESGGEWRKFAGWSKGRGM